MNDEIRMTKAGSTGVVSAADGCGYGYEEKRSTFNIQHSTFNIQRSTLNVQMLVAPVLLVTAVGLNFVILRGVVVGYGLTEYEAAFSDV